MNQIVNVICSTPNKDKISQDSMINFLPNSVQTTVLFQFDSWFDYQLIQFYYWFKMKYYTPLKKIILNYHILR